MSDKRLIKNIARRRGQCGATLVEMIAYMAIVSVITSMGGSRGIPVASAMRSTTLKAPTTAQVST